MNAAKLARKQDEMRKRWAKPSYRNKYQQVSEAGLAIWLAHRLNSHGIGEADRRAAGEAGASEGSQAL